MGITSFNHPSARPSAASRQIWLPDLLKRTGVFFFSMGILSTFFYILGNFQKYLSATLLFLLDLVMKFSYLTLGFSLAWFLLIPVFPSVRSKLSDVVIQVFTLILSLGLFMGASLIFTLLVPWEVSP